ncbi:MAG: hypothetical protein Q8O84_01315 [Nanoarchaeota archaeon]|nr:hypothetical protein [Nanoarchaeota archaeon]
MTTSKDKSKNTLAEKIKGISNEIKPDLESREIIKLGIYGLNYSSGLLSKIYNAPIEIGNAYGAVGFWALDALARTLGFKDTKTNTALHFGGHLFYFSSCVYDLSLALNDKGNVWTHLGNFALDLTMMYQLGKDALKLSEKKGLEFKEYLKYFKPKKDSDKTKNPEGKTSDKKENSKSFKEYLSDFGEKSLFAMELGAGMGYGFGKNAFEKLKENYSEYSKKISIVNRAKRIKKIRKNKEKEKAFILSNKDVSFKKKYKILEHLEDCGKNPVFMEKYEIENEYANFKKKPIDEQIKIMTDKKDSFNKELKQMENSPWIKRFYNSSYISHTKSNLKRIEEILRELDIEEKNPPQRAIDKYLK